MSGPANALSRVTSVALASDDGWQSARGLADEVKSRWREGESPDVARALVEYPELKRYKSIVLDLAYCEYRHRETQGEALDTEEFSRGFPSLRNSLCFFIETRRLLEQDPTWRNLQEDIPWPQPGDCFLGFSLIGELGRGTFGRVYLALESSLGNRPVAIKVAPQGGPEAEMLGKLRHANIVPVHSIEEDLDTDLTAVCMPYLGRATLSDVLDRAFADSRPPTQAKVIAEAIGDLADSSDQFDPQALDRRLLKGSYVDAVLHLGAQLADALAYAHGQGICHHDLKPSNVLLSLDGRPLLLDFNLSSDHRSMAGRVGGTLPYMAPEQIQSLVLDPAECQDDIGPRSDVFSLGVILYELLCGRLPFDPIAWDQPFDRLAESLLLRQRRGPIPLSERNSQVDPRVVRLVHDCLAFRPDDRPRSAQDLAAALRKELGLVRRSRRWVRNHRRLVLAAGALVVMIALAAGVGLAHRDPYSVRLLKLGLACARQSDCDQALKYLGRATETDPKSSEVWLARGQVYQQRGDFRRAFDDYETAFRLTRSGKIAACEGYCLNKLGHHQEAVLFYQQAIRLGGASAVVANNLGFTYVLLDRPEDAMRYLKLALENDGNLQAAHQGMVAVYLRLSQKDGGVPASALVHGRRAVELGPPSAHLCRRVATLYALAARHDRKLVRPALKYLAQAVALGIDPKTLVWQQDQLAVLQDEPEFKKLLAASPRPVQVPDAPCLLDPLSSR